MVNARTNELLEFLPEDEFSLFEPHLELRSLSKDETLWVFSEIPEYVYFPTGAVVSIICELDDGFTVETTLVNKKSVVGLSNTGQPSFYTAKVKYPGLAYRIKLSTFLKLKEECPVFAKNFAGAMFASFRNIHFAAACGKHHLVDQQIVRWILTNLDRSESNYVPATHAQISELLGFRREVITAALGKLSLQRIIDLSRGQLEVLDRQALELRSCECYWLAQGLKRPASFTALINSQKHA